MEELKSMIKSLTPNQRAAFDAICSSKDDSHDLKILKSLEEKGLIQKYEESQGVCTVSRYDMTNISVHRAWCEIYYKEHPEEFEGVWI